MSPTLTALTGFILWTLVLLVTLGLARVRLVMTRQVPPNGFRPDNAGLSPFLQRLARAHMNCIEGLPVFGGLMLVAAVSGHTAITDPLAFVFLGARIAQSLIHLASTANRAVTWRFVAFLVQVAIAFWWAIGLLAALAG
jgi:uncharacterized MAPEG superfamily protein